LSYADGLSPAARYATCLLLGLLAGGGAAVQAVRQGFSDGTLASGPWETGKDFGSADASALVRARVALRGLLALPRDEAMYFTARTDSAGVPFDGRCRYEIRGGRFDARWWSITLYGSDDFLIPNSANRYSVTKNNVKRGADGAFVIRLSSVEERNNWIATSPDGFQITLRLYNPGPAVKDNPATTPLPSIVKEACT